MWSDVKTHTSRASSAMVFAQFNQNVSHHLLAMVPAAQPQQQVFYTAHMLLQENHRCKNEHKQRLRSNTRWHFYICVSREIKRVRYDVLAHYCIYMWSEQFSQLYFVIVLILSILLTDWLPVADLNSCWLNCMVQPQHLEMSLPGRFKLWQHRWTKLTTDIQLQVPVNTWPLRVTEL